MRSLTHIILLFLILVKCHSALSVVTEDNVVATLQEFSEKWCVPLYKLLKYKNVYEKTPEYFAETIRVFNNNSSSEIDKGSSVKKSLKATLEGIRNETGDEEFEQLTADLENEFLNNMAFKTLEINLVRGFKYK